MKVLQWADSLDGQKGKELLVQRYKEEAMWRSCRTWTKVMLNETQDSWFLQEVKRNRVFIQDMGHLYMPTCYVSHLHLDLHFPYPG